MLILLMFFHVCWVFILYVILPILRAPSAWSLDTQSGIIRKLAHYEPKVSANLSNQFEWPLLFYAGCILSISMGISDSVINVCALVFILGRVGHSAVHILTDNIRLRGAIFTVNFLAVVLMWVRLVIIAI